MSQQQPGTERSWWWRVAQHLDAAQLAAVNAVAHNVDDPSIILAFQDSVRQAQAILLEIFSAKGLLPQEPQSPPQLPGVPVPPAGDPPPPPFAAASPFAGFSIPWSGPAVPPPPPPPTQAEPAAPPDLEGRTGTARIEEAQLVEEQTAADDESNGHAPEPHAVVLETPPADVPEAEAKA